VVDGVMREEKWQSVESERHLYPEEALNREEMGAEKQRESFVEREREAPPSYGQAMKI
jgi:hypothetical protein